MKDAQNVLEIADMKSQVYFQKGIFVVHALELVII